MNTVVGLQDTIRGEVTKGCLVLLNKTAIKPVLHSTLNTNLHVTCHLFNKIFFLKSLLFIMYTLKLNCSNTSGSET